MKIFYHATSMDNLLSIYESGILVDKTVYGIYLCEKPEDCLKFVYLHRLTNVLMLKCKVDERHVEESFDHSQAFFKCSSYVTDKDIPTKNILEYIRYDLSDIQKPKAYKLLINN